MLPSTFTSEVYMLLKLIMMLALIVPTVTYSSETTPDKTVLIAILARNKAHVLPRFLKCIKNQTYPKNLITVYIKTDNNSDDTKEMLEEWSEKNKKNYKKIILDDGPVAEIPNNTDPHLWNATRFKALAMIRNNSLQKTIEYKCDYYFVVDCDNFIAPFTLKDLVEKDKPIIAPFLRCIPEVDDLYANFFYSADSTGYFKDHPMHVPIIQRKVKGTYKVDLVHCTYLVNSIYIDKLNYIDGSDDYEFIIFAKSARKHNIEQYVTNEKEYGVQIHFHQNVSLSEEKRRLEAILTLP